VAGIDTAPLAAAQARLVGALVAGEPNPAGFDAARLAVESEMLRARRPAHRRPRPGRVIRSPRPAKRGEG